MVEVVVLHEILVLYHQVVQVVVLDLTVLQMMVDLEHQVKDLTVVIMPQVLKVLVAVVLVQQVKTHPVETILLVLVVLEKHLASQEHQPLSLIHI